MAPSTCPDRRQRLLCAACFALWLALLACATPAKRVREAQDEFNRGASLELTRKTSQGGEAEGSAAAFAHYTRARTLARDTIAEHQSELEQNDLFGQALTIQALSSWRLGDQRTALEGCGRVVALAGEGEAGGAVATRDEAMCRSLRALIDVDNLATQAGGLEALPPAERQRKLTEILENAARTRRALATEAARLPPGHEYHRYVVQAQAEVVFVELTALSNAGDFPQRHADAYECDRRAVLAELAELAAGGDVRMQKLDAYYRELLFDLDGSCDST